MNMLLIPYRIKVSCSLKNGVLPLDYRRGFASLLKEAIKQANPKRYRAFYARHQVAKPFTFSVFFPELQGVYKQENKILNVGQEVVLYFSTADIELGTEVHYGLTQLEKYPLFADELSITDISLAPMTYIDTNCVVFKSMSPLLVRANPYTNNYVLPNDNQFTEGLQHAISQISQTFLGLSSVSIHFAPIQWNYKVIYHYGGYIRGFTGVFQLDAPAPVLNLLYAAGLGARRSQGFGMLNLLSANGKTYNALKH